MQSSIWKFVLPTLILVFCLILAAEERPSPLSQTPQFPNLHSLAMRSGYVFAGTVKAVERIKPRREDKDSMAVMQITFHVDKGYRGVRTGQTIAIHEWAGLWESGERYRAGEHVMLFLYPPSKLGLTSPVPNGRFPVDSGGQIVVPAAPPSTNLPAHGLLPPGLRISPQDFGLALRRAEQE
jgi:hypothetical protein